MRRIRDTRFADLFGNKKAISLTVLVLLFFTEFFALGGIRSLSWLPWGRIALIIGFFILFLWLMSWMFHNYFKLNNVTLRRLLANAISPTWLGVAYLLTFVLHIGWTSNAMNRAKKVVFVSGISIIGMKKDDDDDKKLIISIRNIVPLVSVLDLIFKDNSVNKENVDGFLILDTDGHR